MLVANNKVERRTIYTILAKPKIKLNGDTLWSKSYDFTKDDYASSAIVLTNGNIIITGSSTDSVGYNSKLLIFCVDGSGVILWQKSYGDDAAGSDIQQTRDNNLIISGSKSRAGYFDAYLIKTDLSGDTIWTKMYGTGPTEEGTSLCNTFSGGYIIAGERNSAAYKSDIFVIRANEKGDTLWTETYGGKEEREYGVVIKQTNDSGFILLAWKDVQGNSIHDIYLIRFGKETTKIKKPVNGQQLAINRIRNIKAIELYDLMGRKIKTLPANATLKHRSGVYIVRYIGEGFVNKKIMYLR